MIVYKVDNVWYLAVEMAALMGNGTMSPETVSSIFAELCDRYSFDILMASNDSCNIYPRMENPNLYGELESFIMETVADSGWIYVTIQPTGESYWPGTCFSRQYHPFDRFS